MPGPVDQTGGQDTSDLPADFLHRTTLLLGKPAVATLGSKTVAVAGCGGAGGAAAILLARMGVGGFVLADPGTFDPPDINRQWAAATSTLGRNKAEVYAELLRDINPSVQVTAFAEGVTDDALTDIIAPADVVIDCLDLKVPLPLRLRVYQEAQRRGLYCVSAPIIGTGTLLMMAAPNGMPLDGLVKGIVEHALATSTLPSGFRRYFLPDHVEALERHIHRGMAASLAIAPALAGAFIASELLTVLLCDVFPHWRPPVALPDVLVVEPLRSSCTVVHYQKLFLGSVDTPPAAPPNPVVQAGADPAKHEARRRDLLRAAGYNTVALRHEDVAMDLLTDSWSEVPRSLDADEAGPQSPEAVESALKDLFPYAHIEPVHRGRFAEALLAELLFRRGDRILTNALFPTAQYHLTTRGAELVYVGPGAALTAGQIAGASVGAADIDLVALERELAASNVRAVYVELCNNALGGLTVTASSLREVRRLAHDAGALVILDASRAYTNAAQPLGHGTAVSVTLLRQAVAELCATSDACTASLTKDFPSCLGGMVAVNDATLAERLRGLARVFYGVRPSPSELGLLHAALQVNTRAIAERVALTREVAKALERLGVPVVRSGGSHAVFVDARAFSPHLTSEDHPDVALAAELFALSGIRAAANLIAPEQRRAGVAIARLAVRTGTHWRGSLEPVVEAFRILVPRRSLLRGVRSLGAGSDGLERFELA